MAKSSVQITPLRPVEPVQPVEPAGVAGFGRSWGCILALALQCTVAASGCATGHGRAPRFFLDYGRVPIRADLDALLAAHPLPAGTNISAMEFGRTEPVSHHLVQVRGGESPHVHEHHDLTVVMLRGTAVLTVGAEEHGIAAGDIMFVPRGRVHFVRNTGSETAVAFVIFSPALQSGDSVPPGR
jgi:quercetin dioxygenase-like cupin family protein